VDLAARERHPFTVVLLAKWSPRGKQEVYCHGGCFQAAVHPAMRHNIPKRGSTWSSSSSQSKKARLRRADAAVPSRAAPERTRIGHAREARMRRFSSHEMRSISREELAPKARAKDSAGGRPVLRPPA
jgi:hypothetical protein